MLKWAIASLIFWSGSSQAQSIKDQITHEATLQGVPVPLALAIAKKESNFNSKAILDEGKKGNSIGVFQLLESTARSECNIRDTKRLWKPHVNIWCGVFYLKKKLKDYDGDWMKAALAYNAGRLYTCKTRQQIKKYKCKKGGYLNHFSYWVPVKQNMKEFKPVWLSPLALQPNEMPLTSPSPQRPEMRQWLWRVQLPPWH